MVNERVVATVTSPITEAYSWIEGREFPASRPLIDVSQAVPGYPPPASLTNHLASRVNAPELARYGPVLGSAALRAALAKNIAKAYGSSMPEDHVAITAGCNQAFALAATVLCAPGDEFILPVPYYFNHDMWLGMNGVVARYLDCGPDMTPSVADAAALVTPATKALLLITPNNPTGRVYPPELIADFAALARRLGITLVLDETYRDFRLTSNPAHHLFDDPDWAANVVHLHSFSKVFSITGYRVGGIAASPELLTEIDKVADCLTICPSRIGQEAALFGLGSLADWVEGNRLMMNDRVQAFRTAVADVDSGYEIAAAGAYFAYLRHPFGAESRAVAQRLADEHNILALAGSMFGPGQDAYLRLAFANLDEATMPELASRLAASAR